MTTYDSEGEGFSRRRSKAKTMPGVDAWLRDRTVKDRGNSALADLWQDWTAYMGDPQGQGVGRAYRLVSLGKILMDRGHWKYSEGGKVFMTGIALRPAGEVAPVAGSTQQAGGPPDDGAVL